VQKYEIVFIYQLIMFSYFGDMPSIKSLAVNCRLEKSLHHTIAIKCIISEHYVSENGHYFYCLNVYLYDIQINNTLAQKLHHKM